MESNFESNFDGDFARAPLRLLWDNGGGSAALWRLEAGRKTPDAPLILGPFTRWTARGLAVGAAGESLLLWTGPEGRASVWRVGPGTAGQAGAERPVKFGPYPGWEALGLAAGSDGIARLLWRGPDGTAALWRLPAALDSGETPSVRNFGPYPGWSAASLSVGPDRQVHLLWTHTDGEANLWRLDDGEETAEHAPADLQTQFGPYEDWAATAVTAQPDGTSRLLWRRAGGQASLWTVGAESAGVPPPDALTQAVQGPCQRWTAVGAAAQPGGGAALLWRHDGGGMASVWQLDADGEAIAHAEHGPYSGWVPVALAAG